MIKEEKGKRIMSASAQAQTLAAKKNVMLISDFWLTLTEHEILHEMHLIAEAFRFFGGKKYGFSNEWK